MTSEARRAGPIGLTIGGALAASVIGATVAAAGLARLLITPPGRRRDDVDVIGLAPAGVVLERTPDTALPGRYALWLNEKLVRIGPIVAEDASSVTREVGGKARERLATRKSARFSGYHLFRPRDLGLPFERVRIATPLGSAPAWLIGDQSADTWCVQVHGRGVTRRETLRAVPIFAAAGIPSLVVSYRNDGEAPKSRDGKYRLGLDEWRDVDSAIAFALERGAKRVVVMGWSMGGAIALQLARRSVYRRKIVGLVLESPVVTWQPTLLHQMRSLRLPVALAHAATTLLDSPASRIAGSRATVDFDELDGVQYADAYTIPILLMHSADDGFVPADASRAFAAARPDIVEYDEWAVARHTKLWNYDEARFTATIGAWLDRHGFRGHD